MKLKRIIVAGIAAATLALTIPMAAHASTIAYGTREAAYAPNGNFTRGRVETRVAGIYNTETHDTYGRGRAEIVKGARRLVAYYQRLYEARPVHAGPSCDLGFHLVILTPTATQACVNLVTANEEDIYDGEGTLPAGIVLISTDTEPAPGSACLVTKNGLGIRWDSGILGKRGTWSRTFDNPNPAAPASTYCPA